MKVFVNGNDEGIEYLVMETNTCATNGWFFNFIDADSCRESMASRYPGGIWIVLKSAAPGEYGGLGAMYHNEPLAEKLLEALK